ncbi:MAG: helix-turn-helix domain-containing protein [Planctomycetaceae bacterium]
MKVTPEQEATIRRLKAAGQKVAAIARTVGLSRPTVYAVVGWRGRWAGEVAKMRADELDPDRGRAAGRGPIVAGDRRPGQARPRTGRDLTKRGRR